MSSIKSHLHAANVMLFTFMLVANPASMIYGLRHIDSASFELLHRAGLLYVVGYWLVRDMRRRRVGVPYCPGVFVIVTSFIYLPYYLFKTRGKDAFGIIAIFLAFYVASSLLGVLISAIVFGV